MAANQTQELAELGVTSQIMRQWARANGMNCGTQGRISDAVIRNFRESQTPDGRLLAYLIRPWTKEELDSHEYQLGLLPLIEASYNADPGSLVDEYRREHGLNEKR